jgi:FkbM family methyltransferase
MVMHPFDYPLPSGETVADAVLRPILRHGVTPTVIDVGARNGMMLLPASYARHCCNVGFEPNPVEYRKLVDGKTDAAQYGIVPPDFKESRFHNCAVWDRVDKRPLYVTVGPGATTMMGPAVRQVTDRMFLGGASRKTYEAEHTGVVKTENVDCRPLDEIVGDETVDFLKIDAEGAELRILKGADGLLTRHQVLLIKSEFVLLSYYEEHPLLGHQQAYLAERGYRLIDMDLNHNGYTRRPSSIDPACDRRLKYAGDAYFIPDPDRSNLDAMQRQRLAAICLTLGFNSLGVSLLHEAALLEGPEIGRIEQALSRVPLRSRLRLMWNRFPYLVWGGLVRLRLAG